MSKSYKDREDIYYYDANEPKKKKNKYRKDRRDRRNTKRYINEEIDKRNTQP